MKRSTTPVRSLLLLVVGFFAYVLGGCAIGRPWRGPGLTRDHGGAPVIVSVTHAVVDRSRGGNFDDYVWIVARAMDDREFAGLVGYSIRKEILGDEVWTVTAWTSEDALVAFVRSGTHQRAIASAGKAIVSMRTQRVWLPPSELPVSWERAEAILAQAR